MKINSHQKILCRTFLILVIFSVLSGFSASSLQVYKSNINEDYYINPSLEEDLITIGYNVQTETEILGDKPISDNYLSNEPLITPYLGNPQEDALHLSYPFPPDDRVKVSDTSVYPWSTICKLYR